MRGKLEFEWIQYLMKINTANVHDAREAVRAAEEAFK
jgi:hypothetical protein